MNKVLGYILCLAFALLMGGCGDITGRGPAPLDRTIDPVVREKHERVGYVYCMRGWLGIFSTGMDALADKIDTQVGAPAVSVADEEWIRLREWIVTEHAKGEFKQGPLVLLGHSYGADDQIRVAKYLQDKNITVDLLVLLDPVTPPPISSNVKRVHCIYKSHPVTDWYPAWRGVPASLEAGNTTTLLENINLRTTDVGFDTEPVGHVNIEKIEGIHNMIMEEIKKTCPTRVAWLQGSGQAPAVTQGVGGTAGAVTEPQMPAGGAPVRGGNSPVGVVRPAGMP